MIKITLYISVLVFCFSKDNVLAQEKIFYEGEELNYIVKYGFIKLGEVRMVLQTKRKENENIIYTARCTMKSYDGIPLVYLNSIFETEIVFDGKESYSRRFKATDYKEDAVIKVDYDFNYDSSFIHVKKDNNGKTERDEKISFNKNVKFQDGLSLFYAARLNSLSTENYLVPVFMNEAETSVNYYFASKTDNISISIFDDDINSIRCSGVANFTGVFGLTGEFAGWFSSDDFRIPLKAQLNVIIGNVTLELDSYKRKGWK